MLRAEAVEWITQSHGSIFAVEFRKRTDGEIRLMNCRTEVRAYVKGKGMSYDVEAKQLITVFDMNARGYRCIPIEGIQKLKIRGVWFPITD